MDPIPVSATELRTRARELIERVHYYQERYVVETFGRPMAVIISCEEFEQLQELLKQHAALPAAPVPPHRKPNEGRIHRQKL